MTWGKRKDGQAYNKDRSKGISGTKMNTSPTSDVHLKTGSMERNRESAIKIRGDQIFHTDENGKWNLSHHESQYCPDCRKAGRSKNTGYPINPIASGEADLWDNASRLQRIQILDYLNIDEKSKNGKKFINESYSELPEHIRIELSKMSVDKFGYYPSVYDKYPNLKAPYDSSLT